MAGSAPGDGAPSAWARIRQRVGLAGTFPRIDPLTRATRIDGDPPSWELVHPQVRQPLRVGATDMEWLRTLDGTRSIAEVLQVRHASDMPLSIPRVVTLVGELQACGLLVEPPPSIYEALDATLARTAVERADARGGRLIEQRQEELRSQDQVPWRKRLPMYVTRARFLRSVPALQELSYEQVGELALRSIEEAYPSFAEVLTRGERAERFQVIRSGVAHVLEPGEDGSPERVGTLGRGDLVGHEGLLEGVPRPWRVRVGASQPLETLAFDAGTFLRIVAPSISSFRTRAEELARLQRIDGLVITRELDPPERERLAALLRTRTFADGEIVIQEGDPGESFFIIATGSVEVYRGSELVATLEEGDFFGETALLFGMERTATIAARGDVTLWELEHNAFDAVLAATMRGSRRLMPTLLNRL